MSATTRESALDDEPLTVSSMAIAIGVLLLIAGALTLVAVVFPTPPGVRRWVIIANGGYGVGAGTLLIALRSRFTLRQIFIAYGLSFASVIASGLWSHRHADSLVTLPCEVMTLWLGVYAMYFFSRRAAAVALALIAVVDVALAAVGGAPLPVGVWVFVVPSFVVLLIVVRVLRERMFLLLKTVSELARTDPLTGLCNRRAFLSRLDEELVRVQRFGGELALLVADLDHFKRINDSNGHEAGDRALQAVAGALSSSIREIDAIGRLGGEEFAVLLVQAGVPTAEMVAARIREQLAAASAALGFSLSASIGVAAYWDAASATALLRAADDAAYAAKRRGRDRVAVSAR